MISLFIQQNTLNFLVSCKLTYLHYTLVYSSPNYKIKYYCLKVIKSTLIGINRSNIVFNKHTFQTDKYKGIQHSLYYKVLIAQHKQKDISYWAHLFFFIGFFDFGLRIKRQNVVNLIKGLQPIPVIIYTNISQFFLTCKNQSSSNHWLFDYL